MAEMKLKLQPFRVPNYVLAECAPTPRGEPFTEVPKWSLSDLDSDILSAMCDDFRREVFARAGKSDPKSHYDG